MTEMVKCPQTRTHTVICQIFHDPAYDDPIHYLYQDQPTQEKHLLILLQEHPEIIPKSGPYYVKVDSSTFNEICLSNGVLEGSIADAPLPCDQDEA